MSSAIQNTKILAVDTSPAMLEVLKNFASKHGYDIDGYSDPTDAVDLIERRVEQFDQDYRCVMLGWPQGNSGIIKDLLNQLSSPNNQDLPLVIICQEVSAEIAALARRRAGTKALLWKDYQHASDLIDQLPLAAASAVRKTLASRTVDTADGTIAKQLPALTRVLLVDQAPSTCHSLKDLMEHNGYLVSVANTVEAANQLLTESPFDLIIADYHFHDSSNLSDSEEQSGIAGFQESITAKFGSAVLVVLSAKYTDRVIKNSLAAGATACLFKNEATELLFARVHALARSLTAKLSSQEHHNDNSESAPSNGDSKIADEVEQAGESIDRESHKPVDLAAEKSPVVIESATAPGVVSLDEFNRVLTNTLSLVSAGNHGGVRYSLLLLDVQIEASTGDRLSLGDSAPMCQIVEDAVGRLYKRPRSLTYLGNGQFALLLANRRLQDALMLTRKVLQVVPRMVRYLNDLTLVSHSAVVQIDGSTESVEDFLHQCRAAAAKTRRDRRDNCALVLPLKKYLTALESEDSQVHSVAS